VICLDTKEITRAILLDYFLILVLIHLLESVLYRKLFIVIFYFINMSREEKIAEICELLKNQDWTEYTRGVTREVAEKAEQYRRAQIRAREAISGVPHFY
jgi:hypothetical protein